MDNFDKCESEYNKHDDPYEEDESFCEGCSFKNYTCICGGVDE